MKKKAMVGMICLICLFSTTVSASDWTLSMEKAEGAIYSQIIQSYLSGEMIIFMPPEEPEDFDYCQFLWTIQPGVEGLMRILQTFILMDGSCPWYVAGMTADFLFWIPLACQCNKDVSGCIFWWRDFIYNASAFTAECR